MNLKFNPQDDNLIGEIMAVGDVKKDLQSIPSNGTLDIRPPSGEEWVIHNIYHSAEAELYITNGTISAKISKHDREGGWFCYWFHVTNDQWLQVKNISSSSAVIGYDGVQTK